MRKRILTAALVGTLLIAPGFIPQARADHGWFSAGVGFRVGVANIALVFGQPVGYGYGYGPAYYYRYDRPIAYHGHHCSRYCYREGGYYYHHESCPLVHAHFGAYSVDPYWAFSHYAPRGGYGYRPYYDDYYADGGYYGDGQVYGGVYLDYRYNGHYDRHYNGHYSHYNGHYNGQHNRYYGHNDGRYYGRNDGHYDHRRDGRYGGGHGGQGGHGRNDGRRDGRHNGRQGSRNHGHRH